MKYIYILAFIIVMLLFYNSPTIMHIFHLITDSRISNKSIFYKNIKNIDKDIGGEYHFSCKYPEFYEIGIGAKQKTLKTSFYNKEFTYQPNVKLRVDVYSGDKIIFSQISAPTKEYYYFGKDPNFYDKIVLAHFPIRWCSSNLKFKLAIISGSFNAEGVNTDDLFYLYVSISGIP